MYQQVLMAGCIQVGLTARSDPPVGLRSCFGVFVHVACHHLISLIDT